VWKIVPYTVMVEQRGWMWCTRFLSHSISLSGSVMMVEQKDRFKFLVSIYVDSECWSRSIEMTCVEDDVFLL